MQRALGTTLLASVLAAIATALPARAADDDANAILDKAIKALGGEEKLANAKVISVKTKSTITFNGNDSDMNFDATYQGLDHYRNEFEGNFNGNTFRGLVVLNEKKMWRKFGDQPVEADADAVTNERRVVYMQVCSMLVLPLKGKEFQVQTAGEESVNGSPAVGLKVTGPEGKTFKLYFDKESGLPKKVVATVQDFMGNEFEMDVVYSDFKEFDGIKKATKIEVKRDGEKFQTQEVTEFKVLDKAPADAFSEPS